MTEGYIVWLLTGLALFIGSWIQTALGFGLAVFAAPIIVVLKPEWVPVLLTLMALLVSLLNTWNQRQHIDYKALPLPFLTRIPGTLIGVWLLAMLDTAWLQMLVAACVLLAVLISFAGPQFRYTPARLGWAAFVSGITGTTTSIGGPPMALVMQHGAPERVRGNLSIYFIYGCVVSLLGYVWLGLITPALLMEASIFLPLCAAGYGLGKRSRAYVDAGRFRPLLLMLCGAAGLFAMAMSLR